GFVVLELHLARALELDASLDEERRGADVADQLARGVDLEGLARADVPVHRAPADDDRRDVDLGVDLGAVADDERVVALDLAFEDAVDAHAAFEIELPLEPGAATEECRDF